MESGHRSTISPNKYPSSPEPTYLPIEDLMGNPIYEEIVKSVKVESIRCQPPRTYAEVVRRTRRNNISTPAIDSNRHPIRALLSPSQSPPLPSFNIFEEISNELRPESIDELEDMIVQRLRSRTISVLFSRNLRAEAENLPSVSIETVMSRLRRQLRNASSHLAQEVSLTHRQRYSRSPTNSQRVARVVTRSRARASDQGVLREREIGSTILRGLNTDIGGITEIYERQAESVINFGNEERLDS